MSSRTITIIVLAVVLMLLVMAVAVFLTVGGIAGQDKWAIDETWAQPASATSSMKVTNMTGAGKTDLFVQAGNAVIVLDVSGQSVFNRTFPGTLAASLGDVDGDEVQEIIAYYGSSGNLTVAALKAMGGQAVWETQIPGLGAVGRAAVVDFDGTGRAGVVIGDMRGKLVAISGDGQVRWNYACIRPPTYAAWTVFLWARRNWPWQPTLTAGWSRWRATARRGMVVYHAGRLAPSAHRRTTGPGKSAVLLGGETGTLAASDGAPAERCGRPTGAGRHRIPHGRVAGDPGTREMVAGGEPRGTAYSQTGARLFSASVGADKTQDNRGCRDGSRHAQAKTSSPSAMIPGAVIGCFFDFRGPQAHLPVIRAPMARIGQIAGQRQFLIADASRVRAVTLSKQTAPVYSPLLGGLAP